MLSWNLDLLSSTEILVLWRSLFFLVFRLWKTYCASEQAMYLQEVECFKSFDVWWKWDRNKLLMVHSDDYL